MRNSFLSKSPGERLKEMRFLLAKFQTRATKLEAPFIILVYGSASYGLKKSKFGNLSDIDLFLVVPKELSVDKILQLAGKIFETRFDIEPEHLQEVIDGNWEMCRMYGENKGVRLGFRLLCTDTFNTLCLPKGSVATIRNVAKIGQSRIVVDVEWSITEWKYIPIELEHFVIKQGSNSLLLVNHHVFSNNTEQLGALGRKLLTCTVVYDSTQRAGKTIETIWQIYVRICLSHHPGLSNGDIINSIMRSEKFSFSFRKRLARLIEKVKL